MSIVLKLLHYLLSAIFTAFLLGVVAIVGVYLYVAPDLPEIQVLKDVRLQVPLRVYTRDGALLAEFGEKRRIPLKYNEISDVMAQAYIAAEDDRFYEHPGVDYQGIIRAGLHLLRTGEKGQGGSTITMQVARNFFLTREKTYLRKINEIFLALKIERELSKEEILELYLNKIYLGNRAYGVGAAAQVYYGKQINELNLAQVAMIAGLPKAPSRDNPLANPERAWERRSYVLRRMRELELIDTAAYEEANAAPLTARLHGLTMEVEAPYIAEMVRAEMVERYGEDAYTAGYRVITTVDRQLQTVANEALRSAALAYDERHGYRGPEDQWPDAAATPDEALQKQLAAIPRVGGLIPAVVRAVQEKSAEALLPDGERVALEWKQLSWARKYINDRYTGPKPKTAGEVLAVGDVIRVRQVAPEKKDAKKKDKKTAEARGACAEAGTEAAECEQAAPLPEPMPWRLAQIPQIEGALVSLRPDDGGVNALIGGFDFYHSKFNRVTQARRQPGSSFKPFIYSAALEKGFTVASVINDAPVVFEDAGLESTWRPENYSGKFFGPTRMRVALTHSRNLVSIRLLREIGIAYGIDYIGRFGFDVDRLPRNLSLALGSANVSPWELARAYAVFANGGYLVQPYFIERIESAGEEAAFEAEPATVCRECPETGPGAAQAEQAQGSVPDTTAPAAEGEADGQSQDQVAPRAITAQNHYQIVSMMQDVIRHGTGRKALQLGRRDLAGKTGTTNDQRDAWFAGFNPKVVTVSWVGFDEAKSLGARETGGRAALPMWISFMREALRGVPESKLKQPAGLVTVRIDPDTGLLAASDQQNAIFETFRAEYVPKRMAIGPATGGEPGAEGIGIPEQLF